MIMQTEKINALISPVNTLKNQGGGVSANALVSIVAPKILKNSHGMGSMMTVLGAAVAAAIIVFPLARWQMSLSNNAADVTNSLDNAGVKLEMMSALEDRWRQINDMNIDAFKAATNKTTKYGKYTVTESYGTLGIYNENTGNCDSGTPDDDDKACRVATLTVIGPDGVLPLGPVTATRVASAENNNGGGFNTLVKITETGEWVAPVDGWYKFQIKGAGGGGAAGNCHLSGDYHTGGGGGGGEGGITIRYANLKKGSIIPITIGSGGRGGRGNWGSGGNGEDTIVVINGNEYIGGGGGGGGSTYAGGPGGFGGSGDILGHPGVMGGSWRGSSGGTGQTTGGGNGGGSTYLVPQGRNGGGGAGGYGITCSYSSGYAGGNGIVWIEYFDKTKKD